jgi:hypothetical protein
LSPPIAGSIQAIKSFVYLERRRDQLLTDPPESDSGAWFAQGFLEERTTVSFDRTEPDLTKYFYNFTGIGGHGARKHMGSPSSHDDVTTTGDNAIWCNQRAADDLLHLNGDAARAPFDVDIEAVAARVWIEDV